MNNSFSNQVLLFSAGSLSALFSLFLYKRFCLRIKPRVISWLHGTNQPIPFKRDVASWKAYDPIELKKSGGIYGLMISAVIPRPIALVSSQDPTGIINCAPFSYFNMISHDPPLVVIGCCINGRTKTKKDTLNNIEQTGQFVVNIMSTWYVDSANYCCGNFPPEVNEMEIAGLTELKSDIVKPPRVGESAIHLECEMFDLKPVKNDAGEHTVTLITGKILKIHVHSGVLADCNENNNNSKPVVDWQKLQPMARLGGDTYGVLGSSFDLPRPDRK